MMLAHASSSGTRFLRALVVASTVMVTAVICLNIRRVFLREGVPPKAVERGESRLDSAMLDRIATLRGSSDVRTHSLIGIVNPHRGDADSIASAFDRLSHDRRIRVSVSLYFASDSMTSDTTTLTFLLATLCARREGRLVEFLRVLAGDSVQARRDLSALVSRAQIDDVSSFASCVRRRETIEAVADGQFLVRSLRITRLPAFILDSTVIRGAISLDSLRTRLQSLR